jgi:hypothetical protein
MILVQNIEEHSDRWRIEDAKDPAKYFEGTSNECDRWARENHIRHTWWHNLTNPAKDDKR